MPAWASGPGHHVPPPTRAEGPAYASRRAVDESGLQPFGSPAPATWAVGPGWYKHGPLALKRTPGVVGNGTAPLALGGGWPVRTRSKAAEDCRTPGRCRAPSPRADSRGNGCAAASGARGSLPAGRRPGYSHADGGAARRPARRPGATPCPAQAPAPHARSQCCLESTSHRHRRTTP